MGWGGEHAGIGVKDFMAVPWDHSCGNLTLLFVTEPRGHKVEDRSVKTQKPYPQQAVQQLGSGFISFTLLSLYGF